MLGFLRDTDRYGISRLPENPDQASKRGQFADTAIGYVHIDISELRLAQGRPNMFLAIDRVSKFTYVEFRDDAGKMNGADFLLGVVSAFPHVIHNVLIDNGMAFADLPKNRGRSPAMEAMFRGHVFHRVYKQHGIQHKLIKPYHPWTNGKAERMNQTVTESTIEAFHHPDPESLKAHVLAFVSVDNFANHHNALRWRHPLKPCAKPGRRRLKSSNQICATSILRPNISHLADPMATSFRVCAGLNLPVGFASLQAQPRTSSSTPNFHHVLGR